MSLRFKPVKHLEMIVWTSVLWKMTIHMSQKWPEMVVKPDMCSHFYIESVYIYVFFITFYHNITQIICNKIYFPVKHGQKKSWYIHNAVYLYCWSQRESCLLLLNFMHEHFLWKDFFFFFSFWAIECQMLKLLWQGWCQELINTFHILDLKNDPIS